MVQVKSSPLLSTTEPALKVLPTAPVPSVQAQLPSAYPSTLSLHDALPISLKPVSLVAVYFSVFAPSATPAPNVRTPTVDVITTATTPSVPPLSLTIRLTTVNDAG